MFYVIIFRFGFGYVYCIELDIFYNLLFEVSGLFFLIMGGVDFVYIYRKKILFNYEFVKFYLNCVMFVIYISI